MYTRIVDLTLMSVPKPKFRSARTKFTLPYHDGTLPLTVSRKMAGVGDIPSDDGWVRLLLSSESTYSSYMYIYLVCCRNFQLITCSEETVPELPAISFSVLLFFQPQDFCQRRHRCRRMRIVSSSAQTDHTSFTSFLK